jgi:hypothetical protein
MLAAVTVVASIGMVATPAFAANETGYVSNNVAKSLCAPGGNGSAVTGVVWYQCGTYWDVIRLYAGDGFDFYRIRKTGTNLCLVVRGAANEARAVLTVCGNYVDQHWGKRPAGAQYQLINGSSGKCLLARGTSTLVVQTTCNTRYADQLWRVTPG